ncbi:MAG: hypothetical protein ACK559_30260, partial [bacterium]
AAFYARRRAPAATAPKRAPRSLAHVPGVGRERRHRVDRPAHDGAAVAEHGELKPAAHRPHQPPVVHREVAGIRQPRPHAPHVDGRCSRGPHLHGVAPAQHRAALVLGIEELEPPQRAAG